MSLQNYTSTRARESILATNPVIRNTYLLLSLTLLFSGAIAGLSMYTNAPSPGLIITLVGMFGLSFLTQALRNSPWGLVAIFAFTGFIGYVLGPTLNLYLHAYVNGSQLIMSALGGTGVIFLGLSAYALTTRKDFSYLGGFLFVAVLVAFFASLGGMLFNMPLLQIIISAAFVLISSGYILFTTSQMIHGGERNYIMTTIMLYVAIFNLFVSLLNILSIFGGERR